MEILQIEGLMVALVALLGLVPYALAFYGVVLLVRMSRTQEQILRKLENFETGLRER